MSCLPLCTPSCHLSYSPSTPKGCLVEIPDQTEKGGCGNAGLSLSSQGLYSKTSCLCCAVTKRLPVSFVLKIKGCQCKSIINCCVCLKVLHRAMEMNIYFAKFYQRGKCSVKRKLPPSPPFRAVVPSMWSADLCWSEAYDLLVCQIVLLVALYWLMI